MNREETRSLVIDGETVVFQVEQTNRVSTSLPAALDDWMLTARAGDRSVRLAKLGQGQYPDRDLAHFPDDELERLWRRGPA